MRASTEILRGVAFVLGLALIIVTHVLLGWMLAGL